MQCAKPHKLGERKCCWISVCDGWGRGYHKGCWISHAPGTTAVRAKQEKNARYLATNGASVETVSFEPLGSLGKEGVQTMEAIDTDAAMRRGDRIATPAIARRIMHALEYTQVAGVADALATAAWSRRMLALEWGANPRLGRLAQRARKGVGAGARDEAVLTQTQDAARQGERRARTEIRLTLVQCGENGAALIPELSYEADIRE